MPTSEVNTNQEPLRDGGLGGGDDTYEEALAAFAARHLLQPGEAGVVQAFHAVRNMPYFSGPDRSPLTALRAGRGACTAKHVILRDLLRQMGMIADVEMVECDFAAAIPVSGTMPEALASMARAGGVRDFHCWVRLGVGDHAQRLDATWPDLLAGYGFPVNDDWTGQGDTRPAAPGLVRAREEDVLASKVELLAGLTAEEAEARRAFLGMLSRWLEQIT